MSMPPDIPEMHETQFGLMGGSESEGALASQLLRMLQPGAAKDEILHLVQSTRVDPKQASASAALLARSLDHIPIDEKNDSDLIKFLKKVDLGTRYALLRDAYSVSHYGEGRQETLQAVSGLSGGIMGPARRMARGLFRGRGKKDDFEQGGY